MRALFSVLVLCWAFPPTASAGTILDLLRLLPTNQLEVVTVTDTTRNGALLRPATPANPVFYVAVSAGCHDLGGLILGDKLPTTQEVTDTITKVLAKQGYLPATDLHPPTLLLLWTWGTMNRETNNDLDYGGMQINRGQMLHFLGGYKVGLGGRTPNTLQEDLLQPGLFAARNDAQMLYDLAGNNLYIAVIAAYDYQALVRKESKLLWKTKIGCPSRGHWMPELLPSMLAIAGPNIGRETAKPVVITATDKFKPDVEIGNPTVVEYLGSGNLPVIDATKETASKQPPGKK